MALKLGNSNIKGKIYTTAGWVTIGVGVYLLHKGNLIGKVEPFKTNGKPIIDAAFEVIED